MVVLVGQDQFVEVGGNRDFVVRKITQPSSLTGDSIGKKRKHIRQSQIDGIPFFGFRGFADPWTKVDAKSLVSHGPPRENDVVRRGIRRVSVGFSIRAVIGCSVFRP